MKSIIIFFVIVFALILVSCQSANQILTRSDLNKAKMHGNIQIVSIDSTVYYVNNFSFNDSSINVNGTQKKSGLLNEYIGDLYFKDIAYIQSNGSDIWGNTAFVALTGLILYSGASAITTTSGINADVKIVYPSYSGGSGSCPFIYAWDGNEYLLGGEAFGTALGKALETETSIVLSELKPSDNKLKIKIINERSETHFFNNIKLVAVETAKEATVYSDNNNNLRSTCKHENILAAYDIYKTEITSQLNNDDNVYWESDLSSANAESSFEDKIFIELEPLAEQDSISLIISAVNTDISSRVFSFLQKILGDEFANFTKAAETDIEIIKVLKETLNRSALKVDIWDGRDWKYVDLIYPEANQVEFKKLVRVPVIINNSEMKIRLRCLSDVWKLDAVYFDDSRPKEFTICEIDPLHFQSDSQNNFHFIEEKDNSYMKLLPNEIINIEYVALNIPPEKKVTYAITVGGYLYEWIIDNSKIIGNALENLNTSTPKMLMVKELLKNIDSILPFIYNDWSNSQKELASKHLE